jgi:RNA polymerase sigma-70 factor (ECF subfamily)
MDGVPDNELARRACQKDLEAFGGLARRYAATVYNVCYRLLGERREAEDLAQEVFFRVYRRLDGYDPERPFGPWIRKVATNLCLNHLEAQRGEGLALEETGELPDPRAPSPEQAVEQTEQAERVRKALAELPPRFRAVIELRHFQNLSYAEIAEQLGLPLSDVKSDLFRARKLLAKRLYGDE